MSYASAKGRAATLIDEKSNKPLPELSEQEKTAIAERVRLAKQHIPEVMDFVKAMHAEGLVDGLRCIESVKVLKG